MINQFFLLHQVNFMWKQNHFLLQACGSEEYNDCSHGLVLCFEFLLRHQQFHQSLLLYIQWKCQQTPKGKKICKYYYEKSSGFVGHAEKLWDIQGSVNNTLKATKMEIEHTNGLLIINNGVQPTA